MALELGERFLPRPTTTLTKRRLYCWCWRQEEVKGGGEGERGSSACSHHTGIINPKKNKSAKKPLSPRRIVIPASFGFFFALSPPVAPLNTPTTPSPPPSPPSLQLTVIRLPARPLGFFFLSCLATLGA